LINRDFFQRFPDDRACLDHLMKVRYGHMTSCPRCGREWRFHKLRKEAAYACQWCGHHIHPMAGTPFERTRIPLRRWFLAMHLFDTRGGDVSIQDIERHVGVPYKTAWRISRRLRSHVQAGGRLADYLGADSGRRDGRAVSGAGNAAEEEGKRKSGRESVAAFPRRSQPPPSALRFYGDQFVFDTISGMFYRLNPAACFILQALDTGVAAGQLAGLLRARYELDAPTAARDVELFLNNLAALPPLNRLHPDPEVRG
jgi:transposase-like protein